MADEKKPEIQPTAYVGTVKVNIRGKDYFVHISPPPMGATLDDLEAALKNNRDKIDECQQKMKEAYIDQAYRFKPPMQVNFDTPTQDAIMAHLNINILIPLINIRGGQASFTKPETFHVQQRVELMRNLSERFAHTDKLQSNSDTLPIAIIMMVLISTVLLSLYFQT